MNVLSETEPGGEIVCILDFSARPRDEENVPGAGPRRSFHVGEHVRLVGSFDKRTPEDNPTGPMAVFEPAEPDGRRYAATAGYFVTLDCWDGLRDFFAKSGEYTVRRMPVTEPPADRPRRKA